MCLDLRAIVDVKHTDSDELDVGSEKRECQEWLGDDESATWGACKLCFGLHNIISKFPISWESVARREKHVYKGPLPNCAAQHQDF